MRKLLSLGLKHQEIKDNLFELSLQERNEDYYSEVGMTSAHARVGKWKSLVYDSVNTDTFHAVIIKCLNSLKGSPLNTQGGKY